MRASPRDSQAVMTVILIQRIVMALGILGAAGTALFAATGHPAGSLRLTDLRTAIACAVVVCLLIASEIMIGTRSRRREMRVPSVRREKRKEIIPSTEEIFKFGKPMADRSPVIDPPDASS